MKKRHNIKLIQALVAAVLALLGPFLLPPHVVGVYIPLRSLLFDAKVWVGEPGGLFYGAFLIELGCYFCSIFGVMRFYAWLCIGRSSDVWRSSHLRKGEIPFPEVAPATDAHEQPTAIENANRTLAALIKGQDNGANR